MMNRIIKNRELFTMIFAFIMIGVCLLLGLFLSFEQIMMCVIPILILFIIFTDWLRGREKAKNLKKFMIFRIIIISIILIFIGLYISSSYQSDLSPNAWYMICWFIVMFIGDIIEKKYFIKKETDK